MLFLHHLRHRMPRLQNSPLQSGTTWLRLILLLSLGCLAACSSTPSRLQIDDSVQARGQNSRVEFLVLHYTNSDTARSLKILSQGEVSSHYLVTNGPQPRIYRLVDENRRAWHAGDSAWRGRTWLNASSIGIEIVHEPYITSNNGQEPQWAEYDAEQIAAVITLAKDIIRRHGIRPENVVGHSDIAPTRKQDPGPAFPWRQLAEHGVGRWYDEARAQAWLQLLQQRNPPDLKWFAPRLRELGYRISPITSDPESAATSARETEAALRAFQMHWRPARHDGRPDRESAAILLSLLDTPLEGSALSELSSGPRPATGKAGGKPASGPKPGRR